MRSSYPIPGHHVSLFSFSPSCQDAKGTLTQMHPGAYRMSVDVRSAPTREAVELVRVLPPRDQNATEKIRWKIATYALVQASSRKNRVSSWGAPMNGRSTQAIWIATNT